MSPALDSICQVPFSRDLRALTSLVCMYCLRAGRIQAQCVVVGIFVCVCIGSLVSSVSASPAKPDARINASIRLGSDLEQGARSPMHSATGQGQLALEEARREAGYVPEYRHAASFNNIDDKNKRHNESDDNGGTTALDAAAAAAVPPIVKGAAAVPGAEQATVDDVSNGVVDGAPKPNEEAPSPAPRLACDAAICTSLRDAFLDAIESATCRSFFENGKCPTMCSTSLTAITTNESWPACTTACTGSEAEVFVTGAPRWLRLCGARTESLIDQGKEVVKSFVADGIASRVHTKLVLQFLIGVLILAAGMVYGYRRGLISAQIAYRMQKRRLLGRKNSDANLSV